jgi:hypothetical protein
MRHLNRLMILAIIACGQQFPARAQVSKTPYVVSFVGRTAWSKDECIEKARKELTSQGWILVDVSLNPAAGWTSPGSPSILTSH